MSRIGKKPIIIPKDVKVEIKEGTISVEGPKGKLNRQINLGFKLEHTDEQIFIKTNGDDKPKKALHGLLQVLIVNMIKGVTQGYSKSLEIVGVGFRAEIKGNNLIMHLGFSHIVNFPIPEGINILTPKQTQIIISGIDKEKVGDVAARIRRIFPPEPYKGKGIRYVGEYVKKKIGKAITK